MLQGLINKYQGLDTGVTSGQTDALNNLQAAANGVPNFGTQGATSIGNMFNSSTAPQVGMLSDAYKNLQGNIGATASGANLDPYNTPGFGDALKTMTNDITNQVKGVYAGSGRDPSGAGSFAGSLGRGLTQGLAPTIASEANTLQANQANAANTLYNAAGSTAGAITGQNQIPLANQAQALGLLPQLSQAFTMPATTQLGAANAAYSQPFQNISQLLQPATSLGALGGQSTGTSNTTVTQPQNTTSNILGGVSGGIGIMSSLFSDRRLKDEIREVGELHDGQKIYSYKFKGTEPTQIGLLAQEVRRHRPDAVGELSNGIMMVDYKRATDRAAQMREAA